MKYSKAWGLSLVAALLLVACGGGDPDVPGSGSPSGAPTTPGNFTSLVVFGDSLSDIGTYAPATSLAGNGTAPYFGGKFTTNSDGVTDPIWVQNVATALGLTITPAEVGFAGVSVPCPAANSTCTGYAQGGARVTNPIGVGNDGHGGAALTVPIVTQIARHLARFTNFTDNDLIFVYAGSNDLFVQFAAFGAAATQIRADELAGNITADEANVARFNAQTVAQTAMKTAALELAGYVRDQIVAKGGKYVAVMTLSDIADTPFGNSLQADARPVLTDLSRIFNLWLTEGLTGQPVRLIDTYAFFKEVYNNPGLHGLVNVTDPACSVAAISAITGGAVTTGSSLFCNSTTGAPYNGLTGSASVDTWEFADGVHPTTGAHAILSAEFLADLTAFGWR